MSYTKKQFLNDVAREIKKLRKEATKVEIGALNRNLLNPDETGYCIYGQIADDCRSKRALELISRCCSRYFHPFLNDYEITNTILQNVKGKDVTAKEKVKRNRVQYLSALEAYIFLADASINNVINYLKGQTDILVL